MRKIKFNDGWVFHEGGAGALSSLAAAMGHGAQSREVTLPHDASIEMERKADEPSGSGNGFFQEKTVHYVKEFEMDAADAGSSVWLEFEGVYQNAYVYVNGAFAGKCPYGYGNFYLDVAKYLNFGGKNSVKVIVNNGVPSGRWYTGGGIYRDVNLMIANRLHLAPEGIHLATVEADGELAVVRAEFCVAYEGCDVRDIVLAVELLDAEGKTVASSSMPVTLTEQTRQSYRQKLYVDNPQLWDTDHPYLYTYRARILEQDQVLDEEEGTFGIRRLQLDPRHGLRINGKTVKLRGGCIHHDNGIIGAAEYAHAADRRIRKLKEAGFNAVRSSHYPMSRCLLEACDRQGMLVMEEFSDVWTSRKVDFDYGANMTDWWEHDVECMVNKDYNHPCVIMYSIGNEIPETGNKFDVQWGKRLADKIRSMDDSRYVTNSLNLMLSVMDKIGQIMAAHAMQQQAPGENAEINSAMNSLGNMKDIVVSSEIAGKATEEAFGQVDIAGYNYGTCRYVQDGKTYPDRIIVGSETYATELDVNWELVEKYPYLIGDFTWTAWDYLGEAGIGKVEYGEGQQPGFYAPYPCKAAYCGDLNLIGDRRPVSYWRQMIWGLRRAPYLAVRPPMRHGQNRIMTEWTLSDAIHSWNWKGQEGKPATVEVYADADEVELFVNGQSVGRQAVGAEKKDIALFETVYEPGTLEAVAYRGGQEIGRDVIKTAQDDLQIRAQADAETIPADGSDICYVEISLTDQEGVLNPEADCAVSISVEGPGEIIGFGSADPDSPENYFDRTAKPFEGRLLAAVRGTKEPGTVTVKLKADGCADACVKVEAI